MTTLGHLIETLAAMNPSHQLLTKADWWLSREQQGFGPRDCEEFDEYVRQLQEAIAIGGLHHPPDLHPFGVNSAAGLS